MSAMVVRDAIDPDTWVRELHVIARGSDDLAAWQAEGAAVTREDDWLWHAKKRQAARTMVEMGHPAHPGARMVCALWHLDGAGRVSTAILDAAAQYELQTGRQARFCLLHMLPHGAEEGMELNGVMLICANWVLDGFILVWDGLWLDLPQRKG